MAAVLAVKHVREARDRLNQINSELNEQDARVATMREEMANANETPTQGSPEHAKFTLANMELQNMRENSKVEMESLRLKISLAEHGAFEMNENAEAIEKRDAQHLDAVSKILGNSNEDGPSFSALETEQLENFVVVDADGARNFRLNPQAVPSKREKGVGVEAVYRGDTGDGAELVETTIGMPPVERLKYYGAVRARVQNFTYMGSGVLEVPIGDQTATLAVTSGAGSSMVDETYANFAAGAKDYNVERKVSFGDFELLAHTNWTDRSMRYTEFRNPARFIRMLETSILREENRMMTQSNVDGSQAITARTGVSGLRFMLPSFELDNNNAVTPGEVAELFFKVDPAYRWGSEDGVMMVEDVANEAINEPQAASSLAWMAHDSVVRSLVSQAASQVQNNMQPWFLEWGPQTGYELRLFGLPVDVNNDLGELQAGGGSIAAGSRRAVLAFGRWGYLARRQCNYYLREFTNDSNVKMGALQKAGNAALVIDAFDFNALSVGPTAGKCEAVQAIAHK